VLAVDPETLYQQVIVAIILAAEKLLSISGYEKKMIPRIGSPKLTANRAFQHLAYQGGFLKMDDLDGLDTTKPASYRGFGWSSDWTASGVEFTTIWSGTIERKLGKHGELVQRIGL
jgi:hypothetical protein